MAHGWEAVDPTAHSTEGGPESWALLACPLVGDVGAWLRSCLLAFLDCSGQELKTMTPGSLQLFSMGFRFSGQMCLRRAWILNCVTWRGRCEWAMLLARTVPVSDSAVLAALL